MCCDLPRRAGGPEVPAHDVDRSSDLVRGSGSGHTRSFEGLAGALGSQVAPANGGR